MVVFVGVVSSLVASGMFLAVMYQLRPRILISPNIADQSNEAQRRFAFKIVNRTRNRVFDVEVQALLITPRRVVGGPVNDITELTLTKSRFFEMGAFSKKDADAHYALRFATVDDLGALWNLDTQFLRINVIAKHGLSGFANVSSTTFDTKAAIKKGRHCFGDSLDVHGLS
jgi:hypothetical protein